MKNTILIFIVLITNFELSAQNILLINDNDNITQNTDTFLLALQNSDYPIFTYYNNVDSTQMPSYDFLSNFDILIYYASTDGGGLGIWDNNQNGNYAIRSFLLDGGRGWFIGTDLLFSGGYSTPTTFTQTSFAYEYLGLVSYDSQSYGDDGNMGVSSIHSTSAAPVSFPNTLNWTLGSLWWVDGVTSRTDAVDLYEMGPASYPLYQSVCMTHYKDDFTHAMTSFFDPALILGSTTDRIDFINESLDYLWPYELSITESKGLNFTIYPTIANQSLTIESDFQEEKTYEVFNLAGQITKTGTVTTDINTVSISSLKSGIYFIKIGSSVQKFVVKN